MNKRNHLIDLLRFLAASWVAMFHFNEPVAYIDNWYRNFLKLGYLGVPVFFVISGYCVYLAAEHSKSANDFIIRRFFRIFPPYWFSIFIVGIAVVVTLISHGENGVVMLPKTFASIFATITLLTSPYSTVPAINWVYWTLTFEIFFYLIIYILLLLSDSYQSIWLILISTLTLILPIHQAWLFFFINNWPEFCLGLLAYRLLHHTNKQVWQNAILLILTIISLFTVPLAKYYPYATIITALLIVINHFWPLRNNILSIWGDYSYSIYLIHVPIGIYILGAIKEKSYVQTHIWINMGWDVALLIFVTMLSKLMYTYIELPAIQMGKKNSKKNLIPTVNPN